MSNIATHDGQVITADNGKVTVEMHVLSACASCKAHDKCAFVDKADKIVEVETTEWSTYNVGDSVIVSVNESLGLLAVLLAYVLPAILIVASLVITQRQTGSELLASLVTLALVSLYFTLIYVFRDKLQRKFSFGISHKS